MKIELIDLGNGKVETTPFTTTEGTLHIRSEDGGETWSLLYTRDGSFFYEEDIRYTNNSIEAIIYLVNRHFVESPIEVQGIITDREMVDSIALVAKASLSNDGIQALISKLQDYLSEAAKDAVLLYKNKAQETPGGLFHSRKNFGFIDRRK